MLGESGPRGEAVLRRGLDDEDAYCRMRALLSLALLEPPDAASIALRFLDDPDDYLRLAAVEMAAVSHDVAFKRLVLARMQNDPKWVVRPKDLRLPPEAE